MPNIGSGPGVTTGPKVEPVTLRNAAGQGVAPSRTPAPAAPAPPPAPPPAMVTAHALDAGAMPVDGERVAEIKQAIASNRYPVLPMKISDALIAAGLLLRVKP